MSNHQLKRLTNIWTSIYFSRADYSILDKWETTNNVLSKLFFQTC